MLKTRDEYIRARNASRAEFKAGMNWHDLQASAPIDQVLSDAREAQLCELAIVGRGSNGSILIWGSNPNADAVIGLLMRGVLWLGERDQLTEDGA